MPKFKNPRELGTAMMAESRLEYQRNVAIYQAYCKKRGMGYSHDQCCRQLDTAYDLQPGDCASIMQSFADRFVREFQIPMSPPQS